MRRRDVLDSIPPAVFFVWELGIAVLAVAFSRIDSVLGPWPWYATSVIAFIAALYIAIDWSLYLRRRRAS
jgi:membrane protein implicated in regulation of membrane protease activity